jgi:hypothetical protein
MRAGYAAALVATALAPCAASAHVPIERQQPNPLPVQQALEPSLTPTPQADCGPGSMPETDIQGRVPRSDHESGRAAEGYTCNTELVGSYTKPDPQGTVGGFKVERYRDDQGHTCAYYDSTLIYPSNILDTESGVNVLDMSDPAHPQLTDRLLTPAMLSPHESLLVNNRRGLLGAVLGNPAFYPGEFDLYDISQDCRHPVLKSTTPTGILGHESGWSTDGNTFYSASPGSQTIFAIDVTNSSLPIVLGYYAYDSHGLSISNDGNRAYVAGINSGLIILDTSEIQSREPNPKVHELSRLTWDTMSIPQNAEPVTINGHPYLVEVDEFGTLSKVGAARIIDIGDEAHPRVVSNLRLAVHQPDNFAEESNDPDASSPLQGYAAHYCGIPQREDPGIAACSMILSGMRIFDIRDPRHPREIGYFNAPISKRLTPSGFESSNYAMSRPAFDRKRGDIWYSDGFQGFFVVHMTNGTWPFPRCKGTTSTLGVYSARTKGTGGADVIAGHGDPETIATHAGRDKVCARAGRDHLKGGAGGDILRGGNDDDVIAGGPGRDRIDCGRGRGDVVILGAGDRSVRCEEKRRR